MRIALVHDWLITWRGGEKVLEALLELMPKAEIFTLFHTPESMPASIRSRVVNTAFVDKLPFAHTHHREFLPLLPWAVKSFDLSRFDLVVSSSHCVAKAARGGAHTRHVSYVHAPLRYFWDRFDDYFGPNRSSLAARTAARLMRPWMQSWDVKTAQGIDRFVANSRHVAGLIAQRYGAKSDVVYPPVELERFTHQPLPASPGEAFLCFGALAPYKRLDLAIETFRENGLPLWIAGAGQAEKAWRNNLPANVKWLGPVSDEELPALLSRSRALIFPGEEEFGITPLEMQACGRPVICLGRGGALETVVHEKTGLWFLPQTTQALGQAVERFVREFEPKMMGQPLRAHAASFSKEAFFAGMRRVLSEVAPHWNA